MIKDNLITLLKSRLLSRNDPDIDTIIGLEMDIAQEHDLERHARVTPWFLQRGYNTALTTATSSAYIEVPSDFLIESEGHFLQILDPAIGRYTKLVKDAHITLQEKYAEYENSVPEAYDIGPSYIYVFPTPDAAYSLRWIYNVADTLPSLVGGMEENLWMKYAPNLLLAVTGRRIAALHLADIEMASMFGAEEATHWDRISVETSKRSMTNRDLIMGGAD